MKCSQRAKPVGDPEVLGFIVYLISSHNKDILNYNSSIDLPGRSVLEEENLCAVLDLGKFQYYNV